MAAVDREGLFDALPEQPAPAAPSGGRPRLRRAERGQVELRALSLDDLLPPDHRVRLVWAFAERLDLAPLSAAIRAVAGRPGQPPADPRVLMALWLSATIEGTGSARALARQCREHLACRWLCGGVGVNHKTLADFRVGHGALLERLLVDGFAALLAAGVASLERVAQDGVRVRAGAGAAVANLGSDLGKLAPMNDRLAAAYGVRPRAHLVDGGFAKLDAITAVAAAGVTVCAPVPAPRDPKRDPHAPLPDEPPASAAWRRRMGTAAAKAIYRERAATAERVNAQARNRGLIRLLVRGADQSRRCCCGMPWPTTWPACGVGRRLETAADGRSARHGTPPPLGATPGKLRSTRPTAAAGRTA